MPHGNKRSFILPIVLLIPLIALLLFAAGCGGGPNPGSASATPGAAAPPPSSSGGGNGPSTGGSGGGSSGSGSSSSSFIYVANGSSAILGFAVNSDGSLKAAPGSPFALTEPPLGMIAVQGKFLYVTTHSSLFIFRIDSDGSLTAAGSRSTPNNGGGQFVLDRSQNFLYALAVPRGAISGFRIDSSSGALTDIAGSPFPTDPNFTPPSEMAPAPIFGAVHPSGAYMWVSVAPFRGGLRVEVFDRDSNGALIARSGSARYTADYKVGPGFSVDPGGNFVVDATGDTSQEPAPFPSGVLVYTNSGGNLTFISESSAGAQPAMVTFDRSGSFVLVTNVISKNISVYKMETSGALTEVPGSPFGSGADPTQLAQAGSFIYSANQESGDVSGYHLETNGSLTPVPGSPLTVGGTPYLIVGVH